LGVTLPDARRGVKSESEHLKGFDRNAEIFALNSNFGMVLFKQVAQPGSLEREKRAVYPDV
jgi:hypothetical protein